MQTLTYKARTSKGMAEAAVAWEYAERTWLDRLLGRQRIHYGLAFCSPRDYSGHILRDFGPVTVDFGPRYVEGRTQAIAQGRCAKRPGVATFRKPFLTWEDLRGIVYENLPKSWGETRLTWWDVC